MSHHPITGNAAVAVLSSRESLGDCVMKLPLLRALARAFPEREVYWVVSESDSPFASAMARLARPFALRVVGEARIERPVRQAIARLRELPPFSLVVDTRSNLNRVLLARFALRYEKFIAPTPGYLLSQDRPSLLRDPHRARRVLDLVARVTGTREAAGAALQPPADLAAAARVALPPGRVYVGLAPGASRPYKRWPLERFVALARRLSSRGRSPVFLIGPDERALVPRLRAAVPGALFPGCDGNGAERHLATPEATLALATRLAAAVVNDTGVAHLLAAADTPLVSLFGPTDPRRWSPCAKTLRILRAQEFGRAEMRAIPLHAVETALDDILARRAAE